MLRGPGGERVVPLDGFFEGPFQTQIQPDEILVAIRRGPVPEGAGVRLRKLAQPASGYSIVGVAAVIVKSGGSISHARIGVTGVHEHPYPGPGRRVGARGLRRLGRGDRRRRGPRRPTAPRSTATSTPTPTYRAAMAVVYTRRAIEAALGR